MRIIVPPHNKVAEIVPEKMPSQLKKDIKEMKKIMKIGFFWPFTDPEGTLHYKMKGHAIAHPQVSRNPYAVFVMGGQDFKIEVFINPKIIERSGMTHHKEACLSFPNERKNTRVVHQRYKRITMEWETEKREKKTGNFEGLEAQIFQHEIEHLEGKNIFGWKQPTQE